MKENIDEQIVESSENSESKDSDNELEETKEVVRAGKKQNFSKEATSVLKKWLISHVEHPYLKNNDKLKLSKESGLTKKQVQNWFTNVRKVKNSTRFKLSYRESGSH